MEEETKPQSEPELRPVTLGEVAAHAKPNCNRCHGRGIEWFRSPGRAAEPIGCTCAERRFVRANRDKVVEQKGGLKWKPESPAPTAA